MFLNADLMTVEDVCMVLNRPEISVKPRLSELKNEGFLMDSGLRRPGKWGTNITIWKRNEA